MKKNNSINLPPVGWIPGHSYRSPFGVNVPGFKPEYNYNRDILASAQYAAYEDGFDRYCLIDYPASDRSYESIGPQSLEAKQLNCPFAIEIHLNASTDINVNYGVAFYKKDDPISMRLAECFKKALFPSLNYGMQLEKFLVVGLPDQKWPRLRSVILSDVPTVLLEPFFLTSTAAQRWIQLNSSIPYLGRTIMTISKSFLKGLEK